jgi:hypothetical protein
MRTLAGIFGVLLFFAFAGCSSLNDYDERPTVSVAQGSHGKEPTDAATFHFTMTAASKNDLTVNFSLAGTALIDGDYKNPGTTLVIPKGATAATLSITPIDDTSYETPNRTITLTLAEGTGYKIGANQATVEIQENDVPNSPPSIPSMTARGSHDRPVFVTFDASDPNAKDTLTWTIQEISGGSATIGTLSARRGQLGFDPPKATTGDFSVLIRVSDGVLSTSSTITLTIVNSPPIPTSATIVVSTTPDVPVRIPFPTMTDADGDRITFSAPFSAATPRGTLGSPHDGTVVYSPDQSFRSGTDTFDFIASDGIVSATIPVMISVSTPGPVIADAFFEVSHDATLAKILTAVDPYANPRLSWSITSVPEECVATIESADLLSSMFAFRPPIHKIGRFSVGLAVSNGSATTTCMVWVTVKNHAPGFSRNQDNLQRRIPANTPLLFSPYVVQSDSDSTFIYKIPSGEPKHGVLEIISPTQVRYTPDTTYIGLDAFTLGVTDQVESDEAEFLIEVLAPTAAINN